MATEHDTPRIGARVASIALDGIGLHSGAPCRVTLSRIDGPCMVRSGHHAVPARSLHLVRTDRGVMMRLGDEGPCVDLVEHLFSALAAFGIHSGVEIAVDGGEVPLLDGGARLFCEALRRLSPQREQARLAVVRSGRLTEGDATYRFEPGDGVAVRVISRFREPLGVQDAAWSASPESFEELIAPARTFGFASEARMLERVGRARHVDPRAVMVFDDDGCVRPPGEPMRRNEIARHKLLDILGDFYVYGGPPRGSVTADRPGHGATHAVVRRALESGVLAEVPED